jgi:chaperone modulatory protein CbpM
MATLELIGINEFCIHHQIGAPVVYSLEESGLIEIIRIEDQRFIHINNLPLLEKWVRLYEMDINVEGIETIAHLLDQIHHLQGEVLGLRNKLRLYEISE